MYHHSPSRAAHCTQLTQHPSPRGLVLSQRACSRYNNMGSAICSLPGHRIISRPCRIRPPLLSGYVTEQPFDLLLLCSPSILIAFCDHVEVGSVPCTAGAVLALNVILVGKSGNNTAVNVVTPARKCWLDGAWVLHPFGGMCTSVR